MVEGARLESEFVERHRATPRAPYRVRHQRLSRSTTITRCASINLCVRRGFEAARITFLSQSIFHLEPLIQSRWAIDGGDGPQGIFTGVRWSTDGKQIVFRRAVEQAPSAVAKVFGPDPLFALVRTGTFPSFSPWSLGRAHELLLSCGRFIRFHAWARALRHQR